MLHQVAKETFPLTAPLGGGAPLRFLVEFPHTGAPSFYLQSLGAYVMFSIQFMERRHINVIPFGAVRVLGLVLP